MRRRLPPPYWRSPPCAGIAQIRLRPRVDEIKGEDVADPSKIPNVPGHERDPMLATRCGEEYVVVERSRRFPELRERAASLHPCHVTGRKHPASPLEGPQHSPLQPMRIAIAPGARAQLQRDDRAEILDRGESGVKVHEPSFRFYITESVDEQIAVERVLSRHLSDRD
jgi:hypothetical protein